MSWQAISFYFHPLFLEHLKGIQHPENPGRLEAIRDHLQQTGLWEKMTVGEPHAAPLKWIQTNHTESYIQFVQEACRKAPQVLDLGDTVVTEKSWDAALHAVGACLNGIDDLMEGRAQAVFCAVRPPGHHAERDHAMGFCLFNNVAIAANYAIQQYGLERIFILDWDVHHGNGTQHSFEERRDVFYCSIHQWPHYPGTGPASDRGRGEGEGFTLNIPLPPGSGNDAYFTALENSIIPAIEAYRPQLFLISAGFDAHQNDPLASMRLTTDAYAKMTQRLIETLLPINRARILSVLEGGYNYQALAESVAAHLTALSEINIDEL